MFSGSAAEGGHGDDELGAVDADLALVRCFWALYQARRWGDAQALLAEDASCTWWSTRERFTGAAAIVHVNAIYPEGWRIHLLELHRLDAGRVMSLVRVDHGSASFYAHSVFAVSGGRITALDEYWADVAAPPAWRGQLPGRDMLPADQRPGLDLGLRPGPAPVRGAEAIRP